MESRYGSEKERNFITSENDDIVTSCDITHQFNMRFTVDILAKITVAISLEPQNHAEYPLIPAERFFSELTARVG